MHAGKSRALRDCGIGQRSGNGRAVKLTTMVATKSKAAWPEGSRAARGRRNGEIPDAHPQGRRRIVYAAQGVSLKHGPREQSIKGPRRDHPACDLPEMLPFGWLLLRASGRISNSCGRSSSWTSNKRSPLHPVSYAMAHE
jgi:hypothetical protein